MWRKIEPKRTFVEKKWQISGLPQSSPHFSTDGPVAEQIVGGRVLVRHNKDDDRDDDGDDGDDRDDVDDECYGWIEENLISKKSWLKDSLAFFCRLK